MPTELTKQQITEIIPSLRRYLKEELEMEISEMQTKFLLDYFWKEIAPFAYNKGVNDAQLYFQSKMDDLPGTCFEPELTFWLKKRKSGNVTRTNNE